MTIEESRKTIVLDFDGVLHDYDEWRGAEVIGEPVEGALDFVWWLKERGYGLRIISVRAAHEGGKVAIQKWLKKHGFPKISVSHEKKGGCLYIDDRAIRFEGDFDQMYQYLADNPNPGRWGLKDGSDS
jgi:hypothetical protein